MKTRQIKSAVLRIWSILLHMVLNGVWASFKLPILWCVVKIPFKDPSITHHSDLSNEVDTSVIFLEWVNALGCCMSMLHPLV